MSWYPIFYFNITNADFKGKQVRMLVYFEIVYLPYINHLLLFSALSTIQVWRYLIVDKSLRLDLAKLMHCSSLTLSYRKQIIEA